MKIYLPNNTKTQIGGGWTWARTFKKYAERAGCFVVDQLDGADVMLVPGPTVVDVTDVRKAKGSGIPVVFRVDNVPRKSRNKRSTPHQRMKEIADLADVVVYQSKWAEKYCQPLCGEGTIIYNGADEDIFFRIDKDIVTSERWLWAYHSRGNEMKGFWEAHLRFQLRARENPEAEFAFVADFGSEYQNLAEANFDFWNGEKFEHYFPIREPEQMADLMRQCTHFVYPSISDAGPNVAIEAIQCGLKLIGAPDKELSAVAEIATLAAQGYDFSASRMVDEYIALCRLAGDNSEV